MAAKTTRRATYQDVLDAPEGLTAEVLFGVLYTNPRPAGPHTNASSVLGMDVGTAFQRGRGGPGGWVIADEPELHLGEDILVPDLAGWRVGRMPAIPNTPFIELAPDWACEVLSPSTEVRDRADKMTIYHRENVLHVWLVDPENRTLEAYRRAEKDWSRIGIWHDEAMVRAEPFDAIELELGALWIK